MPIGECIEFGVSQRNGFEIFGIDLAARSLSALLNLETAVGRARVGRDAVRWQGATTLRAHAREAEPGHRQSCGLAVPGEGPSPRLGAACKVEQRGQRAVARRNRVRSGLTQMVTVVVGIGLSVHEV